MKRRVRITGAVLLSLAASSPGCAGKSPWNSLAGKPDLPPPVSVAANQNKGPLDVLAGQRGDEQPKFAQPSMQPPQPKSAEPQRFGAGIGGAVSSMVAKTKDALTIEPEVVRASDPLSLDNSQIEVGAEIYVASARMHESQGNVARADELYRRALEKSPKDLATLMHYARMHDRAGNFDRASEIYRQAINAHPQESAAYNDLGLCLARQNRLAEAADQLGHAVRLQGDNVRHRNNLAAVLVELERHDEALTHLTAAHGPAVGNYNLAFLLHKGGKSEPAALYARQALTLDPTLAAADQLLATIAGQTTGNVAATPQRSAQVQDNHAWPSVAWTQLQRPRPLPPVGAEDWGDAPTPDSLPQLLPPVSAVNLR